MVIVGSPWLVSPARQYRASALDNIGGAVVGGFKVVDDAAAHLRITHIGLS